MQTQTIPEKVSGSGERRDMTACKGLEAWVMFNAVMVGCECAGHGLSSEDSWGTPRLQLREATSGRLKAELAQVRPKLRNMWEGLGGNQGLVAQAVSAAGEA